MQSHPQFFTHLFFCIKLLKSVMKMSSYNCDQYSVLKATVFVLMQACSHPLG